MAYKTADGRIVVQSGDTLWGIAQKYLGNGNRWKELAGFSGDPRKMPIGTVLSLPGSTSTKNSNSTSKSNNSSTTNKTDKDVISDEYAKEEEKYNNVIGNINKYRGGWTNIFTGGDTDYLNPELSAEEQTAIKEQGLSEENKAKYEAYLTALSQVQALRADPYYQQKVAEGLVPDISTPEGMEAALTTIMNKFTVLKTDENGNQYEDSGIIGLGIKSMGELRNMAYMALQDTTAKEEQEAQARNIMNTWQSNAYQAEQTREETLANRANTGLRGGISNRQLAGLASDTSNMMNNINSENAAWREAYIKNANMNNQAYAASTRNQDILDYSKSAILGSGITNADLKNKLTQYTGVELT